MEDNEIREIIITAYNDPIERRKHHQNLYGGEDECSYENEEYQICDSVQIDEEKTDAILLQLDEQNKKNLEEWDRA
jgi:hypothetical protein